jgi:hypothetical protein
MALPTNIRLGWKGLSGTNTLRYYKNSLNTDVKSFTKLGQVTEHSIHKECTICEMSVEEMSIDKMTVYGMIVGKMTK